MEIYFIFFEFYSIFYVFEKYIHISEIFKPEN
jgi:hypothetical protein